MGVPPIENGLNGMHLSPLHHPLKEVANSGKYAKAHSNGYFLMRFIAPFRVLVIVSHLL